MLIDKQSVRWKAVRSGGPGGQRTNRRSTKVQAWVRIADLPLSDIEKRRVRRVLANRINRRDEIEVMCETERFQIRNKKDAVARLNELVAGALRVRRPRVPTEPSRRAEERRIESKKRHGEKKRSRRIG